MNEMQVFENKQFGKIRGVTIDGEAWIVGKDVAAALGYQNTKKALADHVDEEDKRQGDGVTIRDPMGREQKPTVINESGLYALILSSKLPTAKAFKRWVTSEVLPSIRNQNGNLAVNELIKVDYSNDRPVVSARELHEFLEVKTEYRHWFPRMCEYGFMEGQDFNPVKNDRVQQEGDRAVSRTVDDAALTIDMAKEICMLQRTDKGKIARLYFIQLEKDWNSPEKVMARALRIADTQIKKLQAFNAELSAQIQHNEPKVLFADAVSASDSAILIGELAKLLKQNGVENMGQNRLFKWLRDHGYLIRRKGTDYNMPTQKSMEMGLFRVKESVITHSDGHTSVNKTTKVTGKGQQYFINAFLKNGH